MLGSDGDEDVELASQPASCVLRILTLNESTSGGHEFKITRLVVSQAASDNGPTPARTWSAARPNWTHRPPKRPNHKP